MRFNVRVSYIQPNVGLPSAVAADGVTFRFPLALGDNMRLNRFNLMFLQ
jgi:hypothetical protein